MSNVLNALPLPEVYYDHLAKLFWLRDERNRWIRFNEESVRRYLISNGYSGRREEGELSSADQALLDLQLRHNVDYAGGLAGHASGCYEFNGTQILITESPKPIVPRPGDWPLLNQILNGMFNDGQIDQRPYLYGWLQHGLRAYQNQQWAPGQALALAGPVESGKSLLQSLITELFGGREADAHNYMIGRTNFNIEMFRAEHLTLNDKSESTSISVRRELGARIKEITANEGQYCHGKNRDARVLNPIWRLTISLNDDPERIMILPPIDSDIADKIMLLKVAARSMPLPTASSEDKQRFRAALSAELPAFAHYLLHYEIPVELRSARYGIRHYHHPDLLRALDETSPEFRLLEIIDAEYFGRVGLCVDRCLPEAWDATAAEIEAHLTRATSSVKREAEKLFSYPTACGVYLGRLATRRGERVLKRTLHGNNRWTIQPPNYPAPLNPEPPVAENAVALPRPPACLVNEEVA